MKTQYHMFLNALTAVLAFCSISAVGAAAPSGDGLLVRAYEGAKLERQKDLGFVELELLVGSVDPKAPGGLGKSEVLEGYVTKVDYSLSGAKRSTLEVARNYEQALVDAGFQLLFKCSGKTKTCGKLKFDPVFGEFPYSDEHYLIARGADKATAETLTVAIRVPESHHQDRKSVV